jgi:hypothetical protein
VVVAAADQFPVHSRRPWLSGMRAPTICGDETRRNRCSGRRA